MDVRPGPGFPATLHLERTACAPFHEERRMKLTEATMFHRKSGGGPAAKREPSPEGLGINSEDDLSAVGAALKPGPLAPVSLGAVKTCARSFSQIPISNLRSQLCPKIKSATPSPIRK